MSEITKDEMKEITKQALKEWLDDKFMTFGKWSATAFASMAFAAVIYFILKSQGWIKH